MLYKTDHLPRIFSTIECLMGGAVVILGVNCSNDAALKICFCIKTNSLGQKSGNPIEWVVRLSFFMLSALTKVSTEVFWGQAAVWLRTEVIVLSYGFGQGPYLWTFLWVRSGKHDSLGLAGISKTWWCLMEERVNWQRFRPVLSKSCVYANVSLINQMCVDQLTQLALGQAYGGSW